MQLATPACLHLDFSLEGVQCREEMLQQSMDLRDVASPQKPAASPRAEPGWMVNAETQTCASAQTPLWADEQFSFLELIRTAGTSADEQDMQLPAMQRTWCKVHQS